VGQGSIACLYIRRFHVAVHTTSEMAQPGGLRTGEAGAACYVGQGDSSNTQLGKPVTTVAQVEMEGLTRRGYSRRRQGGRGGGLVLLAEATTLVRGAGSRHM
jgi:hypothetical protein